MDRLSKSRFTPSCLTAPVVDAAAAVTAYPACAVMPPAARASMLVGDVSHQAPAPDNVHCLASHKQAALEAQTSQESHDGSETRFSVALLGPDGNHRTVDIMQYRTGCEFSFSDPSLVAGMAPLDAANDRESFFGSDPASITVFVSTPPPGDCP